MNEDFDLLVLGAGPGGYVAAIRAAQLKMKVMIIEKERLGGVCLNWGCIPTKSLLKSADVFSLIKKAKSYGVQVDGVKCDLSYMVDRSRKIADRLNKGVEHLLKKNKVEVLYGKGTLVSSNEILVCKKDGTDVNVRAKKIILATGASSRCIPGVEFDGSCIWSYKDAMTPASLPQSIMIIGSGAIGVEFASMYSALGSKVTIIEQMENVLPREDLDVSNCMEKSLKGKGVDVICDASVKSVKVEKGRVIVTLADGRLIESEKLLVAVGVKPNVVGIGLEKTKVMLNDDVVKTNSFLQTTDDDIYAIGDIVSGPWVAHKASHEAIIAVNKIAGVSSSSINVSDIPSCVYSNPQVASIGLTEAFAEERGYPIDVGKFPLHANGKALAIGEEEGFVKVIWHKQTRELLGVHMIGADVSELIHSASLAKKLETIDLDIAEAIFPHPTLSESIYESVLHSLGRAIHI
ncbi:dihydrolipoyl dehydrogenase [Candidatus Sneabacter namystus]|uniref:Dihydrolipoyl dehydrogenase n=1 Tax=Candidatus Sneabacter namystus TaxID=2601646 RepID=A0A5C0UKB5_9RICK|nr:dihydrolipoyl dehydrogenase [Candidatus Sneabacter namystus]QEK39882.1 dihydrolipoyl dehydrogenase [Candidatus Sneabacter namystus]